MHTQKADDEKLEKMLGNLRKHWEKPSDVNSVELLKDLIDGLNEAEKERLVYLLLRDNFSASIYRQV